MNYKIKKYHDLGNTLKWGEDLTQEQQNAMDNGEIFTLLNSIGRPHKIIFKDSYGQIREGPILQQHNLDVALDKLIDDAIHQELFDVTDEELQEEHNVSNRPIQR